MSYTESTNVISIKDALPKSDAEGITQSEYFDFSVTSNLTLKENDPSVPVNYSIELETLNIDTGYTSLNDDQIKIYLTKVKDGKEEAIENLLISNLPNSDNIKTLYTTYHNHEYKTNTITTNYRLRTWIDYNVDASNWNSTNKYEYKFRININSNTNYVGYSTPSYCFSYTTDETNKTAEITDYNCYKNNNGYETITDVVIPETISRYYVVDNPTEEAKQKCAVILANFNNLGTENATTLCNGGQIDGITLEIIVKAYQEQLKQVPEIINSGMLEQKAIPVTTIGSSAFYINNLTSVTIPNTVTTIGNYAFRDNNLTSVTIPNSVTAIGSWAFDNNDLTSVTIPSSVTTIGSNAFSSNSTLTSIIVDSNNKVYDSRNNSNSIIETSSNKLIQGCKTTIIPSTVTAIGNYAFSGNNLTSVTIPNSVTTIGNYAFYINNLTSVTIPNSVTAIGNWAFDYNNLEYVLINEGSNLTETTGIDLLAFSTRNYTKPLTIYNNSGKKFKWYYVTQNRNNSTDETYNFVTGTVPSYTDSKNTTYASVTITTGTPN